MFEGAQEQRVQSRDGTELAVVAGGAPSGRTVVLVHGYPDTKELWREVAAELAPRYTVIAYDVRGAGESGAPRGPAAYDSERLADDLQAVLDAAAPDQPVHLVGHDWGGIAGWELLGEERFAGRLASFTTVAGPSLAQLFSGLRQLLRGAHLLKFAGRVRRSWYVLVLCTPGMPTLVWRALLRPGVWARYLRYVERVPPENISAPEGLSRRGVKGSNLYRRNVLWRTDAPGSKVRPAVPVQLIVPSGDRWISASYYEGLERTAQPLRRRTIAGSHWTPLAQPRLLARWISEFAEQAQRGEVRSASPWVRGGGVEQLRGRLALVTGAGSGIGRATALALADHGARLLLVDRDADTAGETAAQLADAQVFACDVSDADAMQQLANKVLGEHGVPDVVVNNAGIAVSGPFLETSFEDWRRVLGVNLMGVVHGCRLFGEAMVQRGEGGQIVNTASAAAFTPVRDLPAYSASKAAVLMLSECLRSEMAGHGIGVSAICPGIVATNITRAAKYVGVGEQQQQTVSQRVTSIYERRNFTAGQVAAEIVRAIAEDIAVLPVTPEAKLMRGLSRLSPGLLRRLVGMDLLPL